MPRLIDGDRLIDWLRIVPLENGMIDPDTVVEYVREMQPIGGWITTWDNKRKKYVTHWMPMPPEPPKEEETA